MLLCLWRPISVLECNTGYIHYKPAQAAREIRIGQAQLRTRSLEMIANSAGSSAHYYICPLIIATTQITRNNSNIIRIITTSVRGNSLLFDCFSTSFSVVLSRETERDSAPLTLIQTFSRSSLYLLQGPKGNDDGEK